MRRSLWIGFLGGPVAALLQSALAPQIPLLPVAPFFALIYGHVALRPALWIAGGTGLFLDCFSARPFGLSALVWVITSLIAHRFQSWFFQERSIHLGCYTLLLSSLVLPIQRLLCIWFDQPLAPFRLFLLDWFLTPLCTGLYAICCVGWTLRLFRAHTQQTGLHRLRK